jgi:hydroxymethylbilane synthase
LRLSHRPLRIGTRGSALAVWQTERVSSRLALAGYEIERVEIKTTGDLVPDIPLARIGSRALFTKQIDDALLDGRIDLAVHSLKDLPTELPEGLVIAAVGEREDPRDALVGRGRLNWAELPSGSNVATSSLRRRAQLLLHRPDLQIVDLRGNIDTRLAKLDAHPDWTGIVVAAAGLIRLGLEQRIGERLPVELMLPAPGQGALAVTVRAEDEAVAAAVRSAFHDSATAPLVAAERAFLHALEGGCQVPVAALAQWKGRETQRLLQLHGRVISPGGGAMVEGQEEGLAQSVNDAAALGAALAARLLKEGAGVILAEARQTGAPAVTEP